jgi:hypothetical protein
MGIGNDWHHIFAADPDGYRVIVPDLHGHGRSTNPAKRFTFRQCARADQRSTRGMLWQCGIPQSTLWILPNGAHGPVFGSMAPTFTAAALAHLAGATSTSS